MKIALIGYGKMGKTIDPLAREQGDEIVLRIDRDNAAELTPRRLRDSGAEVAIEFSRPETAADNILCCLRAGVPVVCGTTAWLERLPEVREKCSELGGAFFYASNFSLGVNIFFAVNRYLGRMMNDRPEYRLRMEETHHTEKLDSPSGTAVTLAEEAIAEVDRLQDWANEESDTVETLGIISRREPDVPGTHTIHWTSQVDELMLTHRAKSREGFARGALLAAHWLPGRTGTFGMKDLLDLEL